MSESLSPVKRKLPEVRMACFCDQVIQGADNAISIIRIIDRVTVEVARPPTPADTTNESIPYPVTLFAMLDGVRPWGGNSVEFWARSPRGSFEQKAEIQLGSDDRASDTANFILPTAIDLRRPGRIEVELRLAGKRLARRQLELVVTVPDGSVPATSHDE